MIRTAAVSLLAALISHSSSAGIITHCEATRFLETPRYAETIDFVKKIEAQAPWMKYTSFGLSPAGRDLPLVIVDGTRRFTPDPGKRPVILVFNGIHAGEIDGKDGCLMLLRDMVEGRHPEWIEKLTLLIVPILNVDGHERFGKYNRPNQNGPEGGMGFRVSAEGMNLNRDWMKLETAECRALVDVFNVWRPDVVIDMHTSDGEDFQYDLQYLPGIHPSTSPAKKQYLDSLMSNVTAGMKDLGHVTSFYAGLEDQLRPESGISLYPPSPRFSTSYFDLRDAISILVETHADKDHRTRVLASRDFLDVLFSRVAADPKPLIEAVDTARREARDRQVGSRFAIGMEMAPEKRPFTYEGWEMTSRKSEVTGQDVPVYARTRRSYQTTIKEALKVVKEVTVPQAYVMEPGMSRIAAKLREHGITVERLGAETELEVTAYRVATIAFQQQPFQNHHPASGTFTTEKLVRRFPAGSFVVPGAQAETAVLTYLLEPESGEGLFYWNYFDWIVEEKEGPEGWTMEQWAAEMLKDPAIRAEYESRIAKDSELAKDARKRLRFFYEKSPWFDREVGLYPVFRYAGPRLATVR